MIITCINCEKKFNVNSELIPVNGRTIQCGSCSHVWFFNPKFQNDLKNIRTENQDKIILPEQKNETKKQPSIKKNESNNDIIDDKILIKTSNKNTQIVEYQQKSSFTFSNFLSLVIVVIISFVSFIIILDTFKTPLYNIFPNLELLLYNFFEVLKDIKLFIKDLF